MARHEWVCDECGRTVAFKQPERYDDDDPRSETNGDKRCVCGEDMYFEEIPPPMTATLIPPEPDSK